MKKLFILLISVASFVSCSDPDGVTYNENLTYVAFEKAAYNLPIPVNSSTSVDIKFVASSKSNVARTYNLTVVAEETNANPLTYSVPATLTIPANSYEGIATITGTDNDLVDFAIKKLVIKVSGLSAKESTDTEKITLNVYEVCPLVINDFVGPFNINSWWLEGPSTNDVIAGTAANTLEILDYFENANFVISYDANNNVTFAPQNTNVYYNDGTYQGWIYARMSTAPANVSKIDPCTNKISLWISFYINGAGVGYPDQLEVFVKQ
ncbi:hypothetical protein [Flavobacterium lindanitolerans]|uniref:hypothetical protein n=1 Tax=Flavobacterium lindanitolerans TaxID=428988 RepID=UPI0031D72B81